ncbi:SRPBCC family protein [Alkalihalobacillus hwajinpoensis]|uniref:SRPBCC family protein n=1 Tax=Guptibacillus hwajinpoensis TaxID=208199 RepID=UPI00188367D9|nr:SRPBCC family protein [Pseudalkalibacillus hwajinpoensis]MBF0707888.1 SRPBCC family protein [Pseudalkalibacillus hwajinpoensis]
MISWKEEKVIRVPIETVWDLFRDENIQTIMPKVEEHVLMELEEDQVGAKHRQTYREGKRLETYMVETIAYEDREEYKEKRISFVLGKAFEISLGFILEKVSESETKFIYEGQNKGVNFVGRAMLKLSRQKDQMNVVQEFMDRVESEAIKRNEVQI